MDLNKKTKLARELLLWLFGGIVFAKMLNMLGLGGRRLGALIVIFVVAVFIHLYNSSKKDNYLKSVIGIDQTEHRDYKYDWLRLLAVLMVIATHAIQTDMSMGLVNGPKKAFVLTVVYILCLSCNVIYVMLSGALLLTYREESISNFYLKRITKVVWPMLVYYFFYLWQNLELTDISWSSIGGNLKNFFSGVTPESPHYWLIYAILSIYIVVPFLRFMFRDMPYKILTAFVIIAVIFMGITLFSPIPINIGSFMSSWTGVAVIGYWVTRLETRKYDKTLILFGLGAFATLVILCKVGANVLSLCCNCSPISVLISIAFFSLVYIGENIFGRGNIPLKILSKYSYSIILIHWWSLHWITRGWLNIQIMQYHGGGLFLSIVVTLFVSLIFAICIDNFIVIVVEKCFEIMVLGIKVLYSIFRKIECNIKKKIKKIYRRKHS